MRVRIEADAELRPEEARAVQAAIERYAATRGSSAAVPGVRAAWARAARSRAVGHTTSARTGGRDEWQAARDRRRRAREAHT